MDQKQSIWANYNNSQAWNKAIWGWFPLLTMIPVRSQWGRYNLPRSIDFSFFGQQNVFRKDLPASHGRQILQRPASVKLSRHLVTKINSGAITKTLNSSAFLPLKVLMPFKKKTSEPFGTSATIFSAKTLRNLTRSLYRNLPEPHKVSAPEPSGTSPRILT